MKKPAIRLEFLNYRKIKIYTDETDIQYNSGYTINTNHCLN